MDRDGPGTGEVYRIVAAPPCTPFIRGDMNGDETLDLTDAIFFLDYLFLSGEAPVPLDAADTNGDEDVDLVDGLYLLAYLFTNGDPPPFPFPEPACQ